MKTEVGMAGESMLADAGTNQGRDLRNGQEGTTSQVVVVTPELALEWLAESGYERQRTVRRYHVEYLAETMRRGHFKAGAIEFRRFRGRRYLIDGQHRLHAIVASGIPAELVVIEKVAESEDEVALDYAHTDRGLGRSLLDAYNALGLADESGLTASQIGRLGHAAALLLAGFGSTGGTDNNAKSVDLRVQVMRDWLPEARQFFGATAGAADPLAKRLQSAAFVGVGLVTFRYQPQLADRFWRGLAENDGLRIGDPRRTLMLHAIDPGARRRLGPEASRAAARAWNAFYEGRELTLIQRIDPKSPFVLLGTPFRGEKRGTQQAAKRTARQATD